MESFVSGLEWERPQHSVNTVDLFGNIMDVEHNRKCIYTAINSLYISYPPFALVTSSTQAAWTPQDCIKPDVVIEL